VEGEVIASGSGTGGTYGGSPDGGRPLALEAVNISKSFSGNQALTAFDLTVESGEIHALLGENGSGKSTFIKILAGYHLPDPEGEVLVGGSRLEFGSAESAYQLGCRFVHQDLALVGNASIVDNLCVTSGYPVRVGTIRDSVARRMAAEDLSRVGLDVDPRLLVGTLAPAVQTGVAMARALRTDSNVAARLLVLDEPTATLPESDVRMLIDIVRAIAATGVGVLYVTHRIDEVFELADNATVLRDGFKEATVPVASLDRRGLVTLLVGREFDEVRASSRQMHSETAETVLEVKNLSSGPLHDVSFTVRHGDVVGVAGITGSGRESLLSAVFGGAERQSGTVAVDGHHLAASRPDLAIAAGMAYLPPDRKVHGGIMTQSARENLTITNLLPFWRWPSLRRRPETGEAQRWFERLSVRPGGAVESPLSTFSGGNQQKVLFAKWLRLKPKVFLMDEPTQGVDVGTKAQLHREVLRAAEGGAGIVVSSSDVDELEAICHRVLVLRNGRIAAELTGDAVTLSNISHESFGTGSDLAS
jgi:ribose transport system ATP-binding protein